MFNRARTDTHVVRVDAALLGKFDPDSPFIKDPVDRLREVIVKLLPFCPMCFLTGEFKEHAFKYCVDYVKHRICFKCHYPENGAHDCPMVNPHDFLVIGKVCNRCLLPHPMHPGDVVHGQKCSSNASDTIRPIAAQLWSLPAEAPLRRAVFDFFKLPTDLGKTLYFHWLGVYAPEQKMTYLGLVVLVICSYLDQGEPYLVTKMFPDPSPPF